MVAFLAYSVYAIHESLSDPAATRADQTKAGKAPRNNALVTGELGEENAADQVRDPFQVSSNPVAAAVDVPKPQNAAPPTPNSDPVAEIVQGLRLDATFVQGRDQIAIIDGRMYSKGQHMLIQDDSGDSSTALVVAHVTSTKVILRAGSRNYELSYPDQLGRRPDERPNSESAPSRAADIAEPDPSGQMALIRSILDMALGKSETGNPPSSTSRSASRPPRSPRGSASRNCRGSWRRPVDTTAGTAPTPTPESLSPARDASQSNPEPRPAINHGQRLRVQRHSASDPRIADTSQLVRSQAAHRGRGLAPASPGAGTLPEATLIRGGFITDREIANIYSEDLFLPAMTGDGEAGAVDKKLGDLLPEKLCIDRLFCPVARRDDALDVAFVSPEAMGVIDELQLLTGLRIRPVVAPLSVVEAWLDALYRVNRETKGIGEETKEFDSIEAEEGQEDENILNLDTTPPADANGRIVRMVNQIIEQALRYKASDIHLEQFEDGCKLRCRIDGVLHELPPPSKTVFVMIISRLKVLAKMDIAEKRVPQDGAIALRTGDKRVDLRVNTVPTVYGEKMVMRILDKAAIPLNLTGLGLDERQSKDLIESIHSPYGLALVTGPTGSGKSTTLYSCLQPAQ